MLYCPTNSDGTKEKKHNSYQKINYKNESLGMSDGEEILNFFFVYLKGFLVGTMDGDLASDT